VAIKDQSKIVKEWRTSQPSNLRKSIWTFWP